jgi:hypothetical protein
MGFVRLSLQTAIISFNIINHMICFVENCVVLLMYMLDSLSFRTNFASGLLHSVRRTAG